jgi:hypothetical protein
MLSIRRLFRSKDRSWVPPPWRYLLPTTVTTLSSPHFFPLCFVNVPEHHAAAFYICRLPPPRLPAGRRRRVLPLVGRRRRVLSWSGAAAVASCRSSDAAASSDGRAPPCPPAGWAAPPCPPMVGCRRVLRWSGVAFTCGRRRLLVIIVEIINLFC